MKKEEVLFNVIQDITGVSIEELRKHNRKRRPVDLRRICSGIFRGKLKYGVELTGELLNKDHTSITYLAKTHDLLLTTDDDYKALYNEIYSEFYYRIHHTKYEPGLDEMIIQLLDENEKMRDQLIKLKRLINEERNNKNI